MKQQIKGRIAGSIIVTELESGKLVANFRIAENKVYVERRTGRKRKITKFYTVKAWNGVAASINNHLQNGDLVEFKVDVQPNAWISKETGELKEELVLTVNRFSFIRASRRNDN